MLCSILLPEPIGTDIWSLLWILPLTALVAIVYKATKVERIELIDFLREVVLLWVSITVFMAVTGIVLFLFSTIVTITG